MGCVTKGLEKEREIITILSLFYLVISEVIVSIILTVLSASIFLFLAYITASLSLSLWSFFSSSLNPSHDSDSFNTSTSLTIDKFYSKKKRQCTQVKATMKHTHTNDIPSNHYN